MQVGSDKIVTAKDIIIATGSVPFVPKGIEIDGKHQSYSFSRPYNYFEVYQLF